MVCGAAPRSLRLWSENSARSLGNLRGRIHGGTSKPQAAKPRDQARTAVRTAWTQCFVLIRRRRLTSVAKRVLASRVSSASGQQRRRRQSSMNLAIQSEYVSTVGGVRPDDRQTRRTAAERGSGGGIDRLGRGMTCRTPGSSRRYPEIRTSKSANSRQFLRFSVLDSG